MFVWQSSALPCMLCSAWLERKWFPSLGFSREQQAQFCWAGKVAGFKEGLGAGWREPCLLSSWQSSAEVGAVELKKWASQRWLCVCVCVCVWERERSVVKLWNFEHVYESMDIPICPIDIPICPFWVKPAHSFWPEKATLLMPSPLSAWCNRKRGFGISRPQVSVCCCFLCSFIHLWSSMKHQLCQRHFLYTCCT